MLAANESTGKAEGAGERDAEGDGRGERDARGESELRGRQPLILLLLTLTEKRLMVNGGTAEAEDDGAGTGGASGPPGLSMGSRLRWSTGPNRRRDLTLLGDSRSQVS